MPNLPIPLEYQPIVAALVPLLAIIGWLYWFWMQVRSLRKNGSQNAMPMSDMQMIGAAIGNEHAMDRLREELREIRATLDEIRDALRDMPALPRRRR